MVDRRMCGLRTGGIMDGWTARQMGRSVDGRADRWTEASDLVVDADGWVDLVGGVDGRMAGRTCGWMMVDEGWWTDMGGWMMTDGWERTDGRVDGRRMDGGMDGQMDR